jgi:hypothetical protein
MNNVARCLIVMYLYTFVTTVVYEKIYIPNSSNLISITPQSFMKFCSVVPEICRGQVHGPRKKGERERERERERE